MRALAGIIDGRKIASKVYDGIRTIVKGSRIGIIRTAAEDAKIYAGVVKKNAGILDIECKEVCLSMNSTLQEVRDAINGMENTDGIVLMGFKHLDLEQVYASLPAEKDIEGMCSRHLGLLYRNAYHSAPVPCTPAAVMRIIDEVSFELGGKDVCVINHSPVIGKPLATMLLNRNATVSVCHEFTKDLLYHTRNADVVICGVGIPGFLKTEMVKENAFVIDCGMNRVDGKIVGDADFEGLARKCSYITPVPGGVGPVTTSMLFSNLAKLKKAN
ncbi:MAG: bifunctional 5,10-methylenetetrahydrofolate dehydrogenase/5,10-methenyltetrahydrofolate cyclohydrolase [Thermoplasmata archaeon]|nr:bifunctional 5,10-methylenetetrahydrofolate dehydrogenase/5,10-methenyltetrahydrofolate cyclohydrolase [Thermoplasmata archaeon]